MQPSRIVKSAHKRAGSKLPVKEFARQSITAQIPASQHLHTARVQWLRNKAKHGKTGK